MFFYAPLLNDMEIAMNGSDHYILGHLLRLQYMELGTLHTRMHMIKLEVSRQHRKFSAL